MKICESVKSVETKEHQWKTMKTVKVNENHWKSMKTNTMREDNISHIYVNLNNAKSMTINKNSEIDDNL